MRIPEIVALIIFVLIVMYACAKNDENLQENSSTRWEESVSFTPLSTADGDTLTYKIERWSYRVLGSSDEFTINKSLHINWSEVESVKSSILHNEFPSGAHFKISGDTLHYWGEGDLAMEW